jgi:hypothetical protein
MDVAEIAPKRLKARWQAGLNLGDWRRHLRRYATSVSWRAAMPEIGEYKFAIDAFTPLTLPMKRLYDYLADLIDLFAYESNVHFLRVDEGSAAPSIYVDQSVIHRVETRLYAVASSTASGRAMEAFAALNEKLAEDNAVAELTGRTGRILYFPGRERVISPEVGPIVEIGVVEGEIIQIGGRDDSISVYVRDGEQIKICTTTREKGREIAAEHLFRKVRIHGTATWKRTKESLWKQVRFNIVSVVPIKTDSLSKVVSNLRSIHVPELEEIEDPIKFLDEINREADGS